MNRRYFLLKHKLAGSHMHVRVFAVKGEAGSRVAGVTPQLLGTLTFTPHEWRDFQAALRVSHDAEDRTCVIQEDDQP